jgi:hypothetical protein
LEEDESARGICSGAFVRGAPVKVPMPLTPPCVYEVAVLGVYPLSGVGVYPLTGVGCGVFPLSGVGPRESAPRYAASFSAKLMLVLTRKPGPPPPPLG